MQSRRLLAEWYAQDTWKATQRLTLDYGVRFLWYQPWYTKLPAAVFVPERYDPAKAPRLYEPARINNTNVALDPVTGQRLPNVFVGSFVPGTGDPYNGMVRHGEDGYPRGFRDNQGIHPEPRLGLAWDVFGDGNTALHASAGLYHNAHITARSMDSSANNPPAVNQPTIFYGTMDTLLQQAAFSSRPSSVFGLERDAKTPTSYNWSIGVQRDIGWGTVVDVTYVGSRDHNLEVVRNINVVPDGARFLDQNPQNRDPRNPNVAKPAEFLRPYRGYQNINIRSHFGTAEYNALQVQVNRRYIHGLQFAVAYVRTGERRRGRGRRSGQRRAPTRRVALRPEWPEPGAQPGPQLHVGPAQSEQPLGQPGNPFAVRRLAAVRRERLRERRLGRRDVVNDGHFDFTGGDGGNGADIGGGVRTVRPVVSGNPAGDNQDATPGAGNSWLNAASFARPAGRGDFGNAPRTLFQLPPIVNWNLSVFKNFPLGGRRRIQLRWETYNLLNHTQFSAINTNAQFNAAGELVNQNFGQATAARNPRIMQGSIRFAF